MRSLLHYEHGDCEKIVSDLAGATYHKLRIMFNICSIVDNWEDQGKYSEPMVWIGIYIAIASLLCILAMTADLLHGFRNKKFWFPSKYFSLNAASITVITVAMKLPVDLSSEMPSFMDQSAKLGSLAFMCTMMANFMPSLASKDNRTLLANIIGLSILVITMIVNIFIDIHIGAIKHISLDLLSVYSSSFDCVMVAYIYMAMIILLLTIMISSCLTIPTTKEILEVKYQTTIKSSLADQHLQDTQMSEVEKLRQHVRRYWVMAETGSPQFVMASNPSSTASGVICVIVFILNLRPACVISRIPTINPIFVIYYWKSLKTRPVTPPVVFGTDKTDGNLGSYILKIHDEVDLPEKTLMRISNSMNSFILKTEKEQNKDLLELLERSNGFKGVENLDTDQVRPLLSVELVNSWSLPIVTLTCIAVALPNIPKGAIKSLLKSVGEGLSYTHQVEESLNCEKEYVNIRKASVILWNEVEHKCKWLDKALQKDDFSGKTATEILKWFSDRAKEIVRGIHQGEMVENTPKELIAANSMYRIAETILLRDESNAVPITKKQLFSLLNGMIADIFSACFTNLPRVITVKCQESVIEKREASVKDAAKLLGRTTKIIQRLETRELPRMDPDKMAYIDKWHLYLKHSFIP
ncbi:uncharacterized protein LOC143586428 [Bidens hawaiensis]|uniref:uncharacterized protein LOC143586428 n=1 Tax=Bidens hawaiensis TaxID=980011 RepID=UPI0040495535